MRSTRPQLLQLIPSDAKKRVLTSSGSNGSSRVQSVCDVEASSRDRFADERFLVYATARCGQESKLPMTLDINRERGKGVHPETPRSKSDYRDTKGARVGRQGNARLENGFGERWRKGEEQEVRRPRRTDQAEDGTNLVTWKAMNLGEERGERGVSMRKVLRSCASPPLLRGWRNGKGKRERLTSAISSRLLRLPFFFVGVWE